MLMQAFISVDETFDYWKINGDTFCIIQPRYIINMEILTKFNLVFYGVQ